MRFSEAVLHEETSSHRSFIHETNDLPPPPSSPVHVSSPTQVDSDLPTYEHQSPLPVSSPPIYSDDEIPNFSPMPGPFLDGDDPNAIYDDYSGAWGAIMPRLDDTEQASDENLHADERVGEEPEESDEDEFEGEAEDKNEGESYFGPSYEVEDLTEDSSSSNSEDWWPWANREVLIYIALAVGALRLLNIMFRKPCLTS